MITNEKFDSLMDQLTLSFMCELDIYKKEHKTIKRIKITRVGDNIMVKFWAEK